MEKIEVSHEWHSDKASLEESAVRLRSRGSTLRKLIVKVLNRLPFRSATLIACGYYITTSSLSAADATPIPDRPFEILDNYCLKCHDEVEFKAEINLDRESIHWSDEEAQQLWVRVMKMVESGKMPPKKKEQPSETERAELARWLDTTLSEQIPIGGTAIRRLNRREYQHSISDLFGTDFELPRGFPQDNEANGFDNQAEALTLSGPLLEAYSNVATDLAEKLFPPPRKPVEKRKVEIPPSDFTYAYSSGMLREGAMRLVSKTEAIAHSASWPTHFEAEATGAYQLTVDLSSLNPQEGVPVVAEIFAVPAADAASQSTTKSRKLARFEVTESSGQQFETEVILESGETIAIHYATALISEDPEDLSAFLYPLLEREPKLASAFKQAGGKVARARVGLDHLYELIE
ncbi:MAG: DUF1587 domain-containing protein, partial [Verrucomicrobia bacterium]|nr:DUF1587 domain-containing protein [Verrucomicrobiota bacterium]